MPAFLHVLTFLKLDPRGKRWTPCYHSFIYISVLITLIENVAVSAENQGYIVNICYLMCK